MKRITSVVLSVVGAGLLLSGCGAEEPQKLHPCSGEEFLVDGQCKALTETWTRIETGGETICSRGEPYSFFFHPGTVNKVLVYYAFGGFCFNAALCREGAPNYVTHVEATPEILAVTGGVIDLNNQENPFKDWNIVYVPECTADFQSGNKVTAYPPSGGSPAITINHKGFVNATAVSEWIYSNFLRPETMVLSGSSGGGNAAMMHYPYVRHHYGDKVSHWALVLDSSFGITTEQFLTTYSANWGMYENRPPFIPAIWNASPADLTWDYGLIAGDGYYPNGTIAEFGSAYDILQGFTYSIHGGVQSEWPDKLQEHLANVESNTTNFRYFVVAGTGHIMMNQNTFYQHEINGRRMRDWVADIADGKPVESIQCTEDCSVNKFTPEEGPGQEIGISCLGASHCAGDDICCGAIATQETACAASCEPGDSQLCFTAEECGPNMRCNMVPVMGAVLGICLPALPVN